MGAHRNLASYDNPGPSRIRPFDEAGARSFAASTARAVEVEADALRRCRKMLPPRERDEMRDVAAALDRATLKLREVADGAPGAASGNPPRDPTTYDQALGLCALVRRHLEDSDVPKLEDVATYLPDSAQVALRAAVEELRAAIAKLRDWEG